MSINIYYYTFYFFLIPISTIGYGLTLLYIGNNQKINDNFGYPGLFGIFFIIAYSYFTHLFFPHTEFHNLFILIIGFLLFVIFFAKKLKDIKKKIFLFIVIFLIIYVSSFVFKTHDDFPYYHFSYSYHLTQSDLTIGIGKFNHGYRTASSIFYLNSIFYLPGISFYSFHISAIMILGFANMVLLSKILKNIRLKHINFLSYYCLLAFIFINIFFYRISEHGTDRSAQILIFLLLMEIMIFVIYKPDYKKSISLILMLTALIISLKAFYVLYLIFIIPILTKMLRNKNINETFLLLVKNVYFLLFFVIMFFVSFTSLVNTGCLLYPVEITCFSNLDWAIPSNEVMLMNNWYEQWSKGGATPNFRVDNPDEYIQYFNWVSNWIDIYFFNKVSDFLLGAIFIGIIVFLTFITKKEIKGTNFRNLNLLYFLIIILFFEWFYNHPSLRYGGYVLIGLILFIPLAIKLEKYNNNLKITAKKFSILIVIAFLVFVGRNIKRTFDEIEQYQYKPFTNVFYHVDKDHFRITDNFILLKKSYDNCILKQSTCLEIETSGIKVKKKFGKYIFIRSK